MHRLFSEAEFAKLKAKAYQGLEHLDAGVDRDLFSKAIISVVSDKQHRHPVIAGVIRNFFKPTVP